MPYLYQCNCGNKVGTQVRAVCVYCRCGKKLKAQEIDQDTYRKLFTARKKAEYKGRLA